MNSLIRRFLVLLGAVMLLTPYCAYAFKAEHLRNFYDYNAAIPLNPDVVYEKTERGFKVSHVTYTSFRGVRVPGRFFYPEEAPEGSCLPVVFWVHGMGTGKDEFEAMSLVLFPWVQEHGYHYCFFSIDLPFHGERLKMGDNVLPMNYFQARNNFLQAVIDVKRGLDYLQSRSDVDREEIHLIGASYGAIVSTLVSCTDPRPKAVALIVGGGDFVKLFGESALGPLKSLNELTNGHPEVLNMLLYPLDPMHLAKMGQGKAWSLHNGLEDIIITTGRELYEALPEPKEQYWYQGGHQTTFMFFNDIFGRVFPWFEQY